MIPKIIHYCWFGGNPKPLLVKKCIKSWGRYLKDYKIKEWNESNYDITSTPLYVRQAYEAKKWAFVSDYVRFDLLYKYGGVYFDTDVELIKDLHPILEEGPFMACETDGKSSNTYYSIGRSTLIDVAPGLGICANPGLGIYKELIDTYKDDVFFQSDGTLNEVTIDKRTTKLLLQHGLKDVCGVQRIDGILIYPKEYFNPKSGVNGTLTITDNTYAIHHFAASWYSKEKHDAIKKSKIKDIKFAIKRNLKLRYRVIKGVIKKIIRRDKIKGRDKK